MRSIVAIAAAVLSASASISAQASELEARDAAAIAAIERQVVTPARSGEKPQPVSLAEKMAELGVPGLSIAYFEKGRVRWTRTYGQASVATGAPVTPDVRFQAASMSKAVAAALALRMVDQGKLTLDGDVNTKLRSWRIPDSDVSHAPISLRQLLSHTAGLSLSGYPGYATGVPWPTIAQSLAGTAPSNTKAVQRATAPGVKASYSGGGYSVAQLMLVDVAGVPFDRLAARELFGPLGLRRTGFDQPARGPSLAAAHDETGAMVAGGGNVYPELAAAGLWTTPSDYARFLIALQRAASNEPSAILSPQSAAAMITPVIDDQGLGVRFMKRGGRPSIAHGGSNEGFRCQFVAYLDGDREGAVVMTNGANGGALIGHVLQTLANHYWSKAPAQPS